MPILGVIENMSGYRCPQCGHGADVLRAGGGEELAEELGVRFLGKVPLHPTVSKGSDEGMPFVISSPESEAAVAFEKVVDNLEASIAAATEVRSKTQAAG